MQYVDCDSSKSSVVVSYGESCSDSSSSSVDASYFELSSDLCVDVVDYSSSVFDLLSSVSSFS